MARAKAYLDALIFVARERRLLIPSNERHGMLRVDGSRFLAEQIVGELTQECIFYFFAYRECLNK